MNKKLKIVLALNEYEFANLYGLLTAITFRSTYSDKKTGLTHISNTELNVLSACQTGDWTGQLIHKCETIAKDLDIVYTPNLTTEELINQVNAYASHWITKPYRIEQEKLKILMEKYPSVKKAKEELDLLIKLVEENGTTN